MAAVRGSFLCVLRGLARAVAFTYGDTGVPAGFAAGGTALVMGSPGRATRAGRTWTPHMPDKPSFRAQRVPRVCNSHVGFLAAHSARVGLARGWPRSPQRFYSSGASAATAPAPRVAIVGSGPAGFYTAHRLLKGSPDVKVDMFERLPVPFGLVRFGVAPDHPEVKAVTNRFEELASSPSFSFVGNVTLGSSQLTMADMKDHYDAVVLAYGASGDRELGIPGERDLRGVVSARAFVGWYNGLPDHKDLDPRLLRSHDTAVVVGMGNVALDVARILLAPVEEHLSRTDITQYAIEALRKSTIRRVVLVGRRGPLQAAFTAKEFREMITLQSTRGTLYDPSHLPLVQEAAARTDLPRHWKRLMGLISGAFADPASSLPDGRREWSLAFLRSPRRVLPSASDPAAVGSVELETNRLDEGDNRAVGTGALEILPCGLVLRSIGYRSTPIEGVPFDERRGCVENVDGRVVERAGGDGGEPKRVPGLYTAGWLKRGPTGVIASTMRDAYETADAVLSDLKAGEPMLEAASLFSAGGAAARRTIPGEKGGAEVLVPLMRSRGARPVSFDEWRKIDFAEREKGAALGKNREKVASVQEMLDVLDR